MAIPSGCAFFDQGFLKFVFSGNMTSGVDDIGKDHGRTAEDIVFKGHSFVNWNIVLDFDVVAYSYTIRMEPAMYNEKRIKKSELLHKQLSSHELTQMDSNRKKILHKDLSYKIVGLAMKAHSKLGS